RPTGRDAKRDHLVEDQKDAELLLTWRNRRRNSVVAGITPPAPMIGSRITPATSPAWRRMIASAASGLLKGRTTVSSSAQVGVPIESGLGIGASAGPASDTTGCVLTSAWSWVPWYPPSMRAILGRAVNARASRMANIVASVPELQNRTASRLGTRSHRSVASLTSTGFAAANPVPRAACRLIASTTFGCAWPRIIAV